MPPGFAALKLPLDVKSPAPAAADLRAAFERFATEAFRGTTPPADYVDRLMRLYDVRRKAGDKPVAALKETLSVVLASPMCLYLAEPSPDEKRRSLTSPELATRLSYFLWSAPPDAELRQSDLSKPEVLAAQTNRLLDDPRSEGFLTAFVHQWLGLDRINFFEVNRALYPRFDTGTKVAAKGEIHETIAHILKHNASLRDLLKADYVVINRVLAYYYGILGVKGDGYEKVSLPKNSPRGGLLGMAKDANVNKLAQMMGKEHADADKQGTALAKQVKLTPAENEVSAGLASDAKKSLAARGKESGSAFDRAYVEAQVKEHQTVLDTIDKKLLPAARNEELKTFLGKLRQRISDHLDMARKTQSELANKV